jgi:hypothetical protein
VLSGEVDFGWCEHSPCSHGCLLSRGDLHHRQSWRRAEVPRQRGRYGRRGRRASSRWGYPRASSGTARPTRRASDHRCGCPPSRSGSARAERRRVRQRGPNGGTARAAHGPGADLVRVAQYPYRGRPARRGPPPRVAVCETPSYNSRGTCAIALTWPAGSTTTSADTRTDGSVKVVRSSVMSATRTDVSPGRSGPSRHSEWPARRRSSGWRPLGKRRRISRFALANGQVVPRPPGWDPQPRCDLELTQVRTGGRDWWTLEFEACGPPICSVTYSRPPPYSCSPSRCPVAQPDARSPGPTAQWLSPSPGTANNGPAEGIPASRAGRLTRRERAIRDCSAPPTRPRRHTPARSPERERRKRPGRGRLLV